MLARRMPSIMPTMTRAQALEVLRQPLEDCFVTVCRAASTVTYPANFMLVASLNPCPRGYSGESMRGCTCSPHAVRKYFSKLSGPLLDRIDIHVEVPRVPYEDMSRPNLGESSGRIRQRVERARALQRERLEG